MKLKLCIWFVTRSSTQATADFFLFQVVMSAMASAGDVTVMPCVEQAKITELVNVLTALREMDGAVKVRTI